MIKPGDTLYLVFKDREPRKANCRSFMICSIHTTREKAEEARVKHWFLSDTWVDVIELSE